MTDKLKELRRLVEAATPGPWHVDVDTQGDEPAVWHYLGQRARELMISGLHASPEEDEANTATIVALRNAADALIEVAEAARGCRHTGQAARRGEFRMNADAMRKLWAALRKLEGQADG